LSSPPLITASILKLTNQTSCWLAPRIQWVLPQQQWSNAVRGRTLMDRDGAGQILLPDSTQRANNCTKGREGWLLILMRIGGETSTTTTQMILHYAQGDRMRYFARQ
jgi:hypothetical protein